jgi:putative glutathione S-transferase
MNELAPQSKAQGKYMRPGYSFVCSDVETFPAIETSGNRYYLLVGNPCPWCHRVVMAAMIRNASWIEVVRLVDDAEKASRGGWIFDQPFLGKYKDLREVYDAFCGDKAGFSGRCTAPLLIDVVEQRIVSNESADIIEHLDAIHAAGRSSHIRLRPPALVQEIDAFNEIIFDRLNNGVYKCGFSTSQEAYDESFLALRQTLEELDELLAGSRFLIPGDRFTDADLRVFATIARFDAVYASLFKCVMRVSEYPNVQRWFLECARIRIPGGGRLWDTVDVDDCRRSYYGQLFPLNPGGIVPMRPTQEDVFQMNDQLSEPTDPFYAR